MLIFADRNQKGTMIRKTAVCLAFVFGSVAPVDAQLVINELMQSNIDCVIDDLNDYPDSWVELYNAGNTAIKLNEYKLGMTKNQAEAWALPSQTIGAKQHVLVCCDKEAQKLHTNFRLESGKGLELYLFKSGEVVDQVTGLLKQPAPNISYGRETDGSEAWGYQLTPTPKGPNSGGICERDHILGAPVFSEPGRVYANKRAITLTLSLPEGAPEGTVIRYTTNGSEPTPTNGTTYNEAISIKSTTSFRARLFCDGWLSPRSTTHSYIFHDRDVTLPVISMSIDQKFLDDPKTGIIANNDDSKRKDWRRPLNIEFFFAEGEESQLNQLCETRISGGASRGAKKKSFAIYAHKRFGTKRFDYEFFPDQKPGLKDFKSLVLRNAGNDFDYLYMRDAIIQRSMAQHADLDWQAWRPAIIYINGTYYGMLNIRERANDNNVYTNYDGLEDIDLLENGSLKEGTKDNYKAFQAFYNEHGHTLEEYAEWMDWQEYINLMAMNLYYHNQDFPGNNVVIWRPRAEGGKWRWIAKDTDFGLGLYGSRPDYNTIEWLYNPNYDADRAWGNTSDATRLFRRLMEDKDFNREFIDRCCIYMGDFLNSKGTREIWDPMYEMIKYEYPYHRQLINKWWPKYDEELQNARDFVSKRTEEFYKQLGTKYELGSPVILGINKSSEHPEEVSLTFNDVPLTTHRFDGKFFQGRRVTLKAIPVEGKEVKGWRIIQVSRNGVTNNSEVEGDSYSFLMPECSNMLINTIVSDKTGINDARQMGWTWLRHGDEIILCDVPASTRVTLYDLKGMLLYQTSATGNEIRIPAADGKLYILKVGDETIKLR
jgi:hypothetical protein